MLEVRDAHGHVEMRDVCTLRLEGEPVRRGEDECVPDVGVVLLTCVDKVLDT